MRERSKLHWTFTILLSVLAVVGWTLHWHVTVNNNNVHQLQQPDGLMTVPECASLKLGTTERQLTIEYGFPRGDTQDTGSDSNLVYPLRENRSLHCEITFDDNNKIVTVAVELRNDY